MERLRNIEELLEEINELKAQLYEANNIIDAIKQGAVDALILTKDGKPTVYSIESADYTYRILIEKFGEGAVSISEQGLILYCNNYFAKLIGIPANKLVGSYFYSYMDTVEEYERLKTESATQPSKGELVISNGDKKVHVYASFTDLRPTIEAIGIVMTDLTDTRKQQEALSLYQRQLELKINELHLTNTSLEQFIHVISHDIKEPLRKIIAYSSHLNDTKAHLFESVELNSLKVISKSALRLNSLVDDLVKYSFSTAKVDTAEIDLNLVLKEVMEDLELMIQETQTIIHCEELPRLFASRVQMRQLFSNLINNAIKYRKKEEPAVISIRPEIVRGVDPHYPDKAFCKISFQDNGIGMEPAQLGKIFTIFQRLHMQNEYSGNGIGLAICKKIMENHFGKIEVTSSPGQGSTFSLLFPTRSTPAQ